MKNIITFKEKKFVSGVRIKLQGLAGTCCLRQCAHASFCTGTCLAKVNGSPTVWLPVVHCSVDAHLAHPALAPDGSTTVSLDTHGP